MLAVTSVVDQAQALAGGDDGAGRRAGGLGLAGAAFPDQQLDPSTSVGHVGELDVGAIGEGWMLFEQRADASELGYVKSVAQHDAVRVAHRQRHDWIAHTVEFYRREILAEL